MPTGSVSAVAETKVIGNNRPAVEINLEALERLSPRSGGGEPRARLPLPGASSGSEPIRLRPPDRALPPPPTPPAAVPRTQTAMPAEPPPLPRRRPVELASVPAETPAEAPAEAPAAPAPQPADRSLLVEQTPAPAPPASAPTPPPATAPPVPAATGTGSTRPPAPRYAALPPPVTLPMPTPLVLPSITFSADDAELSAKARDQLAALARQIADNDLRLALNAYAEGEDPSSARRLSLQRALAIRSFLIEQGIASRRIDIRALGAATNGAAARVDVVRSGP